MNRGHRISGRSDTYVDSLVSIEVRNWLWMGLVLEISVLGLMSVGSVNSLRAVAIEELRAKDGSKEGDSPVLGYKRVE